MTSPIRARRTLAVLVVGCLLAACSSGDGTSTAGGTSSAAASETARTPTTGPSASPSSVASATPTVAGTSVVAREAPSGSIAIEMTPDALAPRYRPDTASVPAASAVFFLTSTPISAGPPAFGPHHTMAIGRELGGTPLVRSDTVQAGQSVVFTVQGLDPGTYRFWCTVDTGHGRHDKLGMVGTLTVTP